MNKLILAILLMFSSSSLLATPPQTVPMIEEPTETGDDPVRDLFNKGRRSRPASIICVFDFDSRTITSSSPRLDNIEEYVIIDEELDEEIISTQSCDEFFETLDAVPGGCYVVKFVASDYTLSGIIRL